MRASLVAIALLVGIASDAFGKSLKRSEAETFSAMALASLNYVEFAGKIKTESGRPIRIGVYDKSRGQPYLSEFGKLEEKDASRYVLFDLSDSLAGVDDLDLVYIAVEREKLPLELLARFAGRPVLMVGNHEKLLESGGIIRFSVSPRDETTDIEINLAQANKSGLTLQSRLLMRAKTIIRE